MRFILDWAMDQLGYMPKINVEIGKIAHESWPFPVVEDVKPKKPTVKKATTRTTKKPAVVAKTASKKKVK